MRAKFASFAAQAEAYTQKGRHASGKPRNCNVLRTVDHFHRSLLPFAERGLPIKQEGQNEQRVSSMSVTGHERRFGWCFGDADDGNSPCGLVGRDVINDASRQCNRDFASSSVFLVLNRQIAVVRLNDLAAQHQTNTRSFFLSRVERDEQVLRIGQAYATITNPHMQVYPFDFPAYRDSFKLTFGSRDLQRRVDSISQKIDEYLGELIRIDKDIHIYTRQNRDREP